jgi:hypothetical protein
MKKKYYLAMWEIDTDGDDYLLMETKEFSTRRKAIDFSKSLNLNVGTANTYIELCGADYDEEDVCVDTYVIETLQRN